VTTYSATAQSTLTPTVAPASSQMGVLSASGTTWATLASDAICRFHVPGAAVGTDTGGTKRICLIGDESTNAVEAYTPQTGSWSTETAMSGTPTRYGFGTVAGGDGRIVRTKT